MVNIINYEHLMRVNNSWRNHGFRHGELFENHGFPSMVFSGWKIRWEIHEQSMEDVLGFNGKRHLEMEDS